MARRSRRRYARAVSARPSRLVAAWPVAVAFVLGVAPWLPTLANAWSWDDRPLIVENPEIGTTAGLTRAFTSDFWDVPGERGATAYYRPLVAATFHANYAMFGLAPAGWHATNVALHATCAAVLALFLLRLRTPPRVAAVAAGLFAVHPTLTECVAWVSGRADMIAALPVLVAVTCWASRPLTDPRRARPWQVGAAVAGLVAMFSKELGFVVPVLAVLVDVARGRAARAAARDAAVTFAAPIAIALAARFAAVGVRIDTQGVEMPLATRALFPLQLLGVILWPGAARVEYGFQLAPEDLAVGAVAGVSLLTVTALGGAESRRSAALAAMGLIAMTPSLIAAATRGIAADRFAYLPALFLIPAVVRFVSRRGWLEVAAVAIIPLAVWSAQRSALWRDDVSLFGAALAEPNPSPRVQLNGGIALHDRGRLVEGLDLLEAALATAPAADALYERGLLMMEIGCLSRAEANWRAAISGDPTDVPARHNLVGLLVEQGRFDEARGLAQDSLQATHDPNFSATVAWLAKAPPPPPLPPEPEACRDEASLRALLTDPDHLTSRAVGMLKTGNLEMAGTLLRAALLVQPRHVRARVNLAQLHLLSGDNAQARAVLDGVLAEVPDHAVARKLYGYADGSVPLPPSP